MYERKMIRTMCYKTKEPVYYNKGTRYETTSDTFLFWINDRVTLEQMQELANELNATKPQKYMHFELDWDKIEYLYAGEQMEF